MNHRVSGFSLRASWWTTCELTDISDKLVYVRLLQQPQLAHAGESVQSLVDDELLGVAQPLLQEGLQDGGALPAHVCSHAFNRNTVTPLLQPEG